jgi:hypothetical protein
MDKFTSGDFKSVGSKEALRRLRYIASVPVTRADEVRIDAVVDKRNRLQHYGLDDSVEGIQAVTAGALDFLLTFVDTQLRDPDAPPGDPVEETLNRIQVQVAGIKALVTTRMGSLTPGLGSHEVVLSCPTCTQPALVLGEMCRCLFCLHESEPEQMAKEYVSNILRMSEYQTVKDGGLWPIHRCPACDNETLVEGVIDPLDSGHVNWHDRSPNYWVCFTDDRGWAYGEIDQCTRCGTPTETSDDRGVAICSDCYAYMCSPD